jgi:acid phosphatase type 7
MRDRTRIATLGVALGASGLLTASASAATITVAPGRAVLGQGIALAGAGLPPSVRGSIRLADRQLATLHADRHGDVSLRFRVSRGFAPGRRRLTLRAGRIEVGMLVRVLARGASSPTSRTVNAAGQGAVTSPAVAAPGSSRAFWSWGWSPGRRVALTLGTRALASARAARDGSVRFRVQVPGGAGTRRLVLSGAGRRLVVPVSILKPVTIVGPTTTPTPPRFTTPDPPIPTTPDPPTTTTPDPPTTTTPDPPTTTTPDPPPAPAPLVVATAGDIACSPTTDHKTATTCHQAETADLIDEMQPDAVLPLGDLQYQNATLSEFQQSYDPTWGRFKDISYPTIGNHEYVTPGAAGYFDYFNGVGVQSGRVGDRTKGYYAFDLGGWRFYSLNSTCSQLADKSCAAGSAEETWLKADLAAHPTRCILAYWHYPRFSSGINGNHDTMAPIWQDLQNAGAELVLSGHDHDYERFAPRDAGGAEDPANGIRQFVVGTGGENHMAEGSTPPSTTSEASNFTTFGVMKLTLGADGYSWDFQHEAGASFTDSGSASCH